MDYSCRVLLVTSVTIKRTIDATKHHIIDLRDRIFVFSSAAVNGSLLLYNSITAYVAHAYD